MNSIKKICLLILVLDVSVDQERVSLRMDVFHGDLEAIETSCLWHLNFRAELLGKVLHNDSVTCGEEGQNVFDEVFFIGVQFLPVLEVLVEIDFIGSPKRGEMLLVHLID